MADIRCKKCNRLLMKAAYRVEAEVKCPKCGYINTIDYTKPFDEAWERRLNEIYAE